MSIGEFARRSWLSPKALRLYDKLGLLRPARVDPDSGYRYYEAAQLDRARLVAALRQLRVPLAEIAAIVDLAPAEVGARIAEYWAGVEVEHGARRELARCLVDVTSGKRPLMYEVDIREIPRRSVLCVKRNVEGQQAAWAFGREFVGLLSEYRLPLLPGIAGAWFCIYWGEVSEDSDGPLEWCRPVPVEQAQALAARCPELSLRTEAAHREAFVKLGPGGQTGAVQWQLVMQALQAWAEEHGAGAGEHDPRPSELGARITYLVEGRRAETTGPDCDFAIPIS